MLEEILVFVITIPVGGGIVLLALVGWGAWFTNGNFKEDSKSKVYITEVVGGILFYLWLNLFIKAQGIY